MDMIEIASQMEKAIKALGKEGERSVGLIEEKAKAMAKRRQS